MCGIKTRFTWQFPQGFTSYNTLCSFVTILHKTVRFVWFIYLVHLRLYSCMCEGQRKRVMEKNTFSCNFSRYRLYTMSGERKISSKLIGSSFKFSFSNTNAIFSYAIYIPNNHFHRLECSVWYRLIDIFSLFFSVFHHWSKDYASVIHNIISRIIKFLSFINWREYII